MMMFFAIKTFLGQIPLKLLAAGVALLIGLFAIWLGYSHYKNLTVTIDILRQELTVAKLEVATGKATITELKRRSDSQAQAFSELERRRNIISDEREELLGQLDEIKGDCSEVTVPTGELDPDIGTLNRLNLDAGRVLRGK